MFNRISLMGENSMIKVPDGRDVHISCIEPGAQVLGCKLPKGYIEFEHLDYIQYKTVEIRGIIKWLVSECYVINDDLMLTGNQRILGNLENRKAIDFNPNLYRACKLSEKKDNSLSIIPTKITKDHFDNINEIFYGLLTDVREFVFVNELLMCTNNRVR